MAKETVTNETEAKKPGQVKRTAEELKTLFAEMCDKIGQSDLRLSVSEDSRCTVIRLNDAGFEQIIDNMAGNTFVHYIKGATAFQPQAS